MTKIEISDVILYALKKSSIRVPISFSEEDSFRISIGIRNQSDFSHGCHYLESLGYVNYVHTHGLQLTGKGLDYIERKILDTNPKREFEFEPSVLTYKVKVSPIKVSIKQRIKNIFKIK